MTQEQLTGHVRALLAALVGYLAAKGYLPEGLNEAVGSAAVLLVALWSHYSNRSPT